MIAIWSENVARWRELREIMWQRCETKQQPAKLYLAQDIRTHAHPDQWSLENIFALPSEGFAKKILHKKESNGFQKATTYIPMVHRESLFWTVQVTYKKIRLHF